ncbi:MAG: HAD-IA family hydrolase [Acidobacteria bacterium]|nr:HAD-IA family hydrolase [Acidobacteriota bacterium]
MACLKPAEAILLDAAGTLFDVRPSVGAIYSVVARHHGVDIDPAEAQKAFSRAFREKSMSGFPALSGMDLRSAERSWWLDVVRSVFGDRMSERVLEEYFAEVFEAFRRGDSYEVYPDTRASLEELKSRGFRLGVLSNFDSRLFDVLDQLDLARHFEAVVISWHAGAAKPDSRIFLHAARKLGVAPGSIVHVGDSLAEDYEGACRAGMGAVLLDREGRYRGCDDLERVESLAGLSRLPGLADRD